MPTKKLKLYSWNLNGIRAGSRHGFLTWLKETSPDILCVQETKAHFSDLPNELKNIPGYEIYFSDAKKKGYAGTAIFTKIKPLKITTGIGIEKFDDEGRFLLLEFDNFYLCNTYFPHTQRELARLDFKIEFNNAYLKFIQKLKKNGKPIILTGDFNVAHKEIDLENPKQNERNAGFTKEERLFADQLIASGYIDTFRYLHPHTKKYTWWTYRFNARAKNIGWRIDYFFVSPDLKTKIRKAEIHDKTFGSDHCPISLDLNQ